MTTITNRSYVFTCPTSGKRAYSDRKKARKVAKLTSPDAHAYRCLDCDLWHVGNKHGLTREQHREMHAPPTQPITEPMEGEL